MVKTVNDADVRGKRVLVRMDMDVPMENGEIVDDARLVAIIPTLKLLLSKGAAQFILMGHMGRPEGVYVPELSTKCVALRLNKLLGRMVQHVDDCVDVAIPIESVVVLENLRFHPEEESNDSEFARKLSVHGDLYVNDAFATCHRSHASMVGVPRFLPGCIGLVVQKEIENLTLSNPQRPVVALVGGAKLETKLPIIQTLLGKVDHVLVGGAMMFTFYKAKHFEVGSSLVDEKYTMTASMLLNNEKIVLPTDVVVAPGPDQGELSKVVIDQGMPAGWMGLDIGPASVEEFKRIMSSAKTIVWNGPLGMVEKKPFEKATNEVLLFMASLKGQGVRTIVGGGDSVKMLNKLGLSEQFSHVSTGGGAGMELLEGKELVALRALEQGSRG